MILENDQDHANLHYLAINRYLANFQGNWFYPNLDVLLPSIVIDHYHLDTEDRPIKIEMVKCECLYILFIFFYLHLTLKFLDRRRKIDERLFAQHQQLYILIKKLSEDVREIKAELKRKGKEQDNDLSSQVMDVSNRYILFNLMKLY